MFPFSVHLEIPAGMLNCLTEHTFPSCYFFSSSLFLIHSVFYILITRPIHMGALHIVKLAFSNSLNLTVKQTL